jgi:hypothetical protein
MTYQQHVLDDHLESYVMCRLQEEETEVLEDHLLFCASCQQRLTETQQRIAATRIAAKRVREETSRPEPRGSLGNFFSNLIQVRPVWAMAATAALAVVLVAPRLQQQPPSAAYQEVSLTAMRGGEAAFDAEHGRPLRLHLDIRDLAVPTGIQVTVVSAEGVLVWSSSRIDRPNEESLVVRLDSSLRAGQYWVRVVRTPDQILREYSLRLR